VSTKWRANVAMNISWSGPRAGIPVGGRAEDIKVTYALRRSYADGGGSRTEDFRGCRRCHRVGCSRHGGDRNVELIEIAGRLEPARRGGEGNHLRYTRLEPQELGFGSAVFTCRGELKLRGLQIGAAGLYRSGVVDRSGAFSGCFVRAAQLRLLAAPSDRRAVPRRLRPSGPPGPGCPGAGRLVSRRARDSLSGARGAR
jgi:hypothetical protein